MSTILPIDHHASFEGWVSDNSNEKPKAPAWSNRRSVGFILVCALASWVLVLSPLFFVD